MAAVIQPIALVEMMGLYSAPALPQQYEGTTQSYKKGAPLVYSSGYVVEASANPTAILGIATANAGGTTHQAAAPIVPVNSRSLIFEISIDGAASNNNAPGTGSLAQANVGSTYGITKDAASGFWYLDTSKSGSNQVATLVGFQTNATNGTNDAGVVNGRALIQFLAADVVPA